MPIIYTLHRERDRVKKILFVLAQVVGFCDSVCVVICIYRATGVGIWSDRDIYLFTFQMTSWSF